MEDAPNVVTIIGLSMTTPKKQTAVGYGVDQTFALNARGKLPGRMSVNIKGFVLVL